MFSRIANVQIQKRWTFLQSFLKKKENFVMKFYGKYRIKLELLSKFDRESVDRAFDNACEVIDFKAFAAEFALKETKKGTDRDKLIRKLQRLGHDTTSIRGALSLLSQSDE